ncbi:HAD family hydrolase [Rhodococcoides fascians]|uniref:HAD family hydrolase n=1 Tax=Rhodococcoides fascians TaxID=1828 RepID=UPI00050CF58E|nr:HAD family phosphatase [Rhodococcus fascians]
MSSGIHLQGVLWDMDGTLLDSEKIWDVAIGEYSRNLGTELSAEVRESTLGNSMWDALRKVLAHASVEVTDEHLNEGREWLTTRVGDLFAEGIPWRPGAKDALALVREMGLSTGLVTNTERGLVERALDTLGREYFDITVTGDEVEVGKPHPAPYLRGAALLGVDAGACLAVEDSPTGSLSAHTAGCPVLVVPSEIAVPTAPGYTIRDGLVGLTADDVRRAWAA